MKARLEETSIQYRGVVNYGLFGRDADLVDAQEERQVKLTFL